MPLPVDPSSRSAVRYDPGAPPVRTASSAPNAQVAISDFTPSSSPALTVAQRPATNTHPRRTDYAATAKTNSTELVVFVDRAALQSRLPKGFELQPVPGAPEGKHPLLVEACRVAG